MEDELEPKEIDDKFYPEKFEVTDKTVSMNLRLQEVAPDRIQYKPYGISYYCYDIYVQVIVPKEEVVKLDTTYIILTPRGVALVADQLSSALEENYNEWRGRSKTF